jgi:hypothetical protein
MNNISLIQRALGKEWDTLPAALKSHYQFDDNYDEGWLNINYPGYLHPFFSLLHRFGALLNRRGNKVITRVDKKMRDDNLYFARTLRFPDGHIIMFNTRWEYDVDNKLIEFVNPFLGLRMKVWLNNGKLHYESCNYVLQIGSWRVSIPEWLLLGSAYIVESPLDEQNFAMDFYIQHPLLGKIYSYSGEFSTASASCQ